MTHFLLSFLIHFLPTFSPHPDIEVIVFLHDECIISQYYTHTLDDLHQEYNELATFKGVFPNPQIDLERLLEFKNKYKLDFELINDPNFELVEKYGATVTPEVFVIDHRVEKVLYSGRIDNAYARVGKKRTVVTTHELQDVLSALAEGESSNIKNQPAIGCLITPINAN